MNKPLLGLSLMLEKDFLAGTLPLFENDEVEVLEWSPDIGWNAPFIPEWSEQLLQHYSDNERLLGHGVTFSPNAAVWTNDDSVWLENLKREVERRSFLQFSEHFGCSRSAEFQTSAPLPVPLTSRSIQACRSKMQKLKETVKIPIGLENLALAFSSVDVANHGKFLEEILSPFDGFMVLDLHNLYCQLVNFAHVPGFSAAELLQSYPLERVREIHISGGSWSMPDQKYSINSIRRDTHDGDVPDEVFSLLDTALNMCPNVEYVIFERLGGTMTDADQQKRFRDDFRALQQLLTETMSRKTLKGMTDTAISKSVQQLSGMVNGAHPYERGNDFHSQNRSLNEIEQYQKRLMSLLNTDLTADRIIEDLQAENESEELHEYISRLEPRMIDVGKELMKKWSR